jgi:hypothetical protein
MMGLDFMHANTLRDTVYLKGREKPKSSWQLGIHQGRQCSVGQKKTHATLGTGGTELAAAAETEP